MLYFTESTLAQLAPTLFLWVKGTGLLTPRGPPLRIVSLRKRKASELLLQTSYSKSHLVFSSLKRFKLHGIKDIQQKGRHQDGEAQRCQQVEGGTRERLFSSQGQPGYGSDSQL